MTRYSVDCRFPDGEEPIVIGPYEIEANSLHEAIGVAWGLMKQEVEMYDGTIDDLDGFEITPPKPNTERSEDYRSEAREQFRARIWRVFEERQYTYPDVAQSLAAHRAAAEAVYAAALRDVLSAMRHRYDNVIDTDDLIRWAAARGIDLEDAP